MSTGLTGAKMFPDPKVECYGCEHPPHAVGRCPYLTAYFRQLCACTTPRGETVSVPQR